jgi:hypothetical protein
LLVGTFTNTGVEVVKKNIEDNFVFEAFSESVVGAEEGETSIAAQSF